MDIKLNDFCYMYRGKVTGSVTQKEELLLSPIESKNRQFNKSLLLIHGFSSSPAVYRRMLPQLTMYDTICCPILPGHGESIEAFAKATGQDWLTYISHICEQLCKTHETVDVMGMSLGGVLACHLSNQFELNHLYLLAPALSLKLNIGLCLTTARLLHRIGIPHIPNKGGNLCSDKHPELTYRKLPIHSIIQILSLIRNFNWKIPNCNIDVFLGRFDDVVDSAAVAKHFEGKINTQIHWLNNSAHVLPLDNDLEEIIHCIQEKNRVGTTD